MQMHDAIKAFFRGDLEDTPEALAAHSRDASLFEVRPKLVAYPKDADDVAALVRYVWKTKDFDPSIAVAPRSAGTCMAGGSLTNSISLDCMRYLNSHGAVKLVPARPLLPRFPGAKPVTVAGEIHADPGAYYRDIEKDTLAQGLILPSFTASKSINALGGMIGNNSGGELSLKYGKTQDYVKDLDVVLADGSRHTFSEIPRAEAEHRAKEDSLVGHIYRDMLELLDRNRALIEQKRPRVSKNSAGYALWDVLRRDPKTGTELVDLTQLVTGSQGTLAVVTGATVRLVPDVSDEAHSALMTVFLTDISRLGEIVGGILQVEPEAVEAYDDKTIKLAVRFWRGFIKKRGFWGALALGLRFIPEFFMLLGGMPKIVLLVEAAGPDKAVAVARLELLKKKLARFPEARSRIVRSRAAGEKYWIIRHDSFALLREHFAGKRTAPFVDDVIVPPARLPEFLPALRAILEKHGLTYNIHGHAGNGNFHIIPLIEMDARLSEKMILEVSEEVYRLVALLGGSITAEHNDGIIRTPYLGDMFGPQMTRLFAEVKKIWDPKNILNPGKKVGLTKGDIGKYLIHF